MIIKCDFCHPNNSCASAPMKKSGMLDITSAVHNFLYNIEKIAVFVYEGNYNAKWKMKKYYTLHHVSLC